MQEASKIVILGEIATSLYLVSKVKWGVMMAMLGYGRNDDSVISMKLFH